MSKQKYRLTFRCGDCLHEFKKITTDPDLSHADCPKCRRLEAERRLRIGDGAVSDAEAEIREPKGYAGADRYQCENCLKKLSIRKENEDDVLSHCYLCGSQNVRYIGRAMSGITSQTSRTMITALDKTAEATMKQYGMTDLRLNSNMREGDNCAPKLPPRQQQMVDGFFNHNKNPFLSGINANAIGQRAIAGAYRDPNNPVAALHNQRVRPATEAPMPKLDVSVKQQNNIRSYDKMLTSR